MVATRNAESTRRSKIEYHTRLSDCVNEKSYRFKITHLKGSKSVVKVVFNEDPVGEYSYKIVDIAKQKSRRSQ